MSIVDEEDKNKIRIMKNNYAKKGVPHFAQYFYDWSDEDNDVYIQKYIEEKEFKNFKLENVPKKGTPDFLFTTCESLIANDGSLLISSNQIAEKKLIELPENFIVFATTSQFVNTISEGLQVIKAKNKSTIPSNITTIKHFKANETNDFLSYGSSTKNLYLLLLENL